MSGVRCWRWIVVGVIDRRDIGPRGDGPGLSLTPPAAPQPSPDAVPIAGPSAPAAPGAPPRLPRARIARAATGAA